MHVEDVADFLAAWPPPVHTTEVEAWRFRVEAELGRVALPGLVELLEIGSPAEQDAAMAAAQSLGAEVWASGSGDDFAWRVTLPGESTRTIRPGGTPDLVSSDRPRPPRSSPSHPSD